MSFVVYVFGSGLAFFLGIAMLLGALAVFVKSDGRWLPIVASCLAVIGLAVIGLSAVPLPYWFYGIAAGITLVWLVAERATGGKLKEWRQSLRYRMVGVWVIAVLIELPYHLPPRVAPVQGNSLYVIGDSVSAGVGDDGEQLWPVVLQTNYGVDVHNLAQMGATSASAMKQAEQLPDEAQLVLVEIGGNDLLGPTTASDFERDLDQLLKQIAEEGRQIVMFELPLPPLCNEYGRVQRRLASRYDVQLIPKRVFISVIAGSTATLDSIHLTEAGHQRMAEQVWQAISKAYE